MQKISVILPTYNRNYLIGRAIRSVMEQTYQNFELIIVDDGSKDNTKQVVESFKSDKIRYILHPRNKGASAARNTGIKAAFGEYIAFQDDDDEWLPHKLEKQMEAFQNVGLNAGVVYSNFWKIFGNKKEYIHFNWVGKKEGYILKELLKENFIGTPTSLVRKECFNKAGHFDESLEYFEDWELWLRVSRYYKFICVPEPLLISYYSPGGVSDRPFSVKAETIKYIIDKHSDIFKEENKILSKHYYYIGNLLSAAGQNKDSIKYFVKSIKSYPLQLKPVLKIILSYFMTTHYHN